jgi:DNA-binding MarR family transcriptional regulator
MEYPQLKLDNQICFPLYSASRLITKLYQPILSQWDLTYPQYLVLLLLWEQDHRNVSDICNCLLLETSTLTPLLKRLETKGYISRTRSAKDERNVIIELTEKGNSFRELAKDIPETIIGSLQKDTVSETDIVQLKRILADITAVISESR